MSDYNTTIKKFNNLFEYNFYTSPESVLDEDDTENSDGGGDAAPMSELPQDSDMNAQGGEMDMGGEQPMDDTMNQDQGMDDNLPQEDDMNVEPEIGGEEIEIDVTELVDKQEELKQNVGNSLSFLSDKFDDILNIVNGLENKINKSIEISNKEITSLKDEIIKRNPTETEKLNVRSQDSYPYNVSVEDFWNSRTNTHGYDVTANNDPKEKEEYLLTQGDLENSFNEDEVLKTMDECRQITLSKLFNI